MFTIKDLKWVPLDKLTPQEEALKVRPVVKDEAYLQLVESIKAKGLIDPFTVVPAKSPPGVYVVLGGNRRLEAAKEAFKNRKAVEVPAVIGEEMSALDQLATATIENIVRENMTPTQIYDVSRRLKKMGVTTQLKQAQVLGLSPGYLSQVLSAGRSGRIQQGGPVKTRPSMATRTETFICPNPKCKAKVSRIFDDDSKSFVYELAGEGPKVLRV